MPYLALPFYQSTRRSSLTPVPCVSPLFDRLLSTDCNCGCPVPPADSPSFPCTLCSPHHQICSKSFKRPQDLKKHERIHTSEHQTTHKHSKAASKDGKPSSKRSRTSISSEQSWSGASDASNGAFLLLHLFPVVRGFGAKSTLCHRRWCFASLLDRCFGPLPQHTSTRRPLRLPSVPSPAVPGFNSY